MPSKPKTTRYVKFGPAPRTFQINGEQKELSEAKLRQMVDNTKKLMSKGAKIPAPFAHKDEKGRIPSPVNIVNESLIDIETGEPINWRSDLNGGFLHDIRYGFYTDPDTGEQMEGVITEIDVFGDSDDPNTPAGKVGKTIQETSFGFEEDMIDSENELYEGYTPLHVAMVVNPVEEKQPNFALAMNKGSEKVIMMATDYPNQTGKGPTSTGSVSASSDDPSKTEVIAPRGDDELAEAIALLQSSSIDMPDDTDRDNFIKVLILLLRQRQADVLGKNSGENDKSLTEKPEGGTAPTSPVAMSKTSDKELNQNRIFFNRLKDVKKKELLERTESFVKGQQISADHAKQTLVPKIEKELLAMSLATLTDEDVAAIEDNKFPRLPVEDVLDGIDSATSPKADLTKPTGAGNQRPPGSTVPELPPENHLNQWGKEHADMTEAEKKALFKAGRG